MNPFDCDMPARKHRDVENRVSDLLAGHLLSGAWGVWPGTDGLTVVEVVGSLYLLEARSGRVPDPVELARQNTGLANGIAAYFGRSSVVVK